MVLKVVGSSYRLAPPSQLQLIVAEESVILTRLLGFQKSGRIRGAVLLSTCNRFEIVVDTDGSPDQDLATSLLGEAARVPYHQYTGFAAAEYLLRVTTGLESMVRGEEQILGQMRDAIKHADAHGLMSSCLHVFCNQLMAASRDLRQRSGITKTKVSVAGLAAKQLARSARRMVVVGTGKTGRLAIEALHRRGHRDLLIVNRTYHKALALAKHYGARAMSLERFLALSTDPAPKDWDGVLFAINSREPMFKACHAAGLDMVVDVSMPSVLHASVQEVAGLQYLDLDGLALLVQAEVERREHHLLRAEGLVGARAKALHRTFVETGTGSQFARVLEMHLSNVETDLQTLLNGELSHLDAADQEKIRRAMLRTAKRNAHLHLKDLRHWTSQATDAALKPTAVVAPRQAQANVLGLVNLG